MNQGFFALPLDLWPARASRTCPQIGTAATLEGSTRGLAAELLVTLGESRDKAPGMVRALGMVYDNVNDSTVALRQQHWRGARQGAGHGPRMVRAACCMACCRYGVALLMAHGVVRGPAAS